MLKVAILNIFRFILKLCLPEHKNLPMEKMYHLLICRNRFYYERVMEKLYCFESPSTKENIELLGVFIKTLINLIFLIGMGKKY